MKQEITEKLKNWSENAILAAELEASGLEGNPGIAELRKLVAQAHAVGMPHHEIVGLVWTPYSDIAETVLRKAKA